ncbi:polysaccharide biosynthesis tyrosine autokinase [Geodermatophilus sp. CPCC 205761]|uniref:polysaccharide biosynthesis tyrosine autokinase n=1 Tax=Geodermatophilus sp. CPCC 205761 TaxID=2936597 RepID=UPI003EEAF691
MDLRDVISALRASWWLPVLGVVLLGSAALAVSLRQTPLYTSSAQLFVSTSEAASTSDFLQGSQFSEERISSYAALITGEALAGRVIERLQLDRAPSELSSQITATPVPETVLIDVTVTDPSAEQAQRIAVALSVEISSFVSELETPANGATSPVRITVTDRPEVPGAPSSPETSRNITLGVLVGLLAGSGLAIARARLDRSVKDPAETADLAGAPVLGSIVRDAALGQRHVVDRRGGNRVAEDYRRLRTNLQFLDVDEPPRTIVVSSALPSEGKTTLVINLALALVDAGRRVTIVEADLRRPSVARYLGLVGRGGLANVLMGTATLAEVTQAYGRGLSVVTAGSRPPTSGELLASGEMTALLGPLGAANDFVLIDAPAILSVADASGLAPTVDGVLLVVRHGSTRKDDVESAALTVRRVGGRVLGVVLNGVPRRGGTADYDDTADPGYLEPLTEEGPRATSAKPVNPEGSPGGRAGRH